MERVIFSDNGTLIDYTEALNMYEATTATIPFVAAEDYLYIGSDLPFNHKYFDVTTANDQASVISITYWDGNEWVSAVDVQDETKTSGISMARSGHLQWTTDKDKAGWAREDTEDISDLSTLKIYELYWLRIGFSANLKSTFAINYIGYKFAEDANVGVWHPELALSTTYTQFATGKTSWKDQHFAAANEIIRDLKKKRVIKNQNQILNWRLFTEAAVHKVAEIVFHAFGDDFENNRKAAKEYYDKAMDNVLFEIDQDANARLDLGEKLTRTGFMTR